MKNAAPLALLLIAATCTAPAYADPLTAALDSLASNDARLEAGLNRIADEARAEFDDVARAIPALAALSSADIVIPDGRQFGIGLGLAFDPRHNAPAGAIRMGWRYGNVTASVGAAIPSRGDPIVTVGISASW